ncbi:hypothetical protein GHYDROH2_27210 [Geobacter hydrogenophilus]|uniref:Uncharacterized protein n=1 Tax=Geobacter hydrogenophilus TaxID=40983 RepID=A0A9W6G2H3_9BACT|nr:hypothetical protein GHYDROH2_27210 [Geobacter hydrogenophilus]
MGREPQIESNDLGAVLAEEFQRLRAIGGQMKGILLPNPPSELATDIFVIINYEKLFHQLHLYLFTVIPSAGP